MTEYEFFGPPGALAITLGCPLTTYALYFLCNDAGCPPRSFLESPVATFTTTMWPGWAGLYDHRVMGAYVLWFLGLAAMQYVLPGTEVEGVVLKDGTRLKYKFNSTATFATIVAYCAVETYRHGFEWALWVWLWDHYLHLVTAALVFAAAQATYTYVSSFFTGEILALGNTGNPIYDWFIGRPLNPRIGSFDLKSFSELRPGLMLWALLNFAFLARQQRAQGRVTDSMVLVNAFQLWYVADSFWHEPAILSTMDITQDGFGFMLSFGDLVWVPFVYSLQARYLAGHAVELGARGAAAVVAVHAAGYAVFRGANAQKDRFRRDPQHPAVRHLRALPTAAGSRLLVDGWWRAARHVNYLGDWIMAWAWCLPTAFATPVTYFYVLYFAVLLMHRDRRDEAKCRAKYGDDWERYCQMVPYRIVPGVY